MSHRNELCRMVKLAGLALVAALLLGAAPAAIDHDEIVRKNPLDGDAYYNRAMYYRARGEYQKSISDFDQASRIYAVQLAYYQALRDARAGVIARQEKQPTTSRPVAMPSRLPTASPGLPSPLPLPAIPSLAKDEESLFDSKGEAVAYINRDDRDEPTIYLWNGKPVAYLRGKSVWGFNGKHLGWFEKGLMMDHDGEIVGCIKNAVRMVYMPEDLKDLKDLKPLKELRELEPLKPLRLKVWGKTRLARFLAAGES